MSSANAGTAAYRSASWRARAFDRFSASLTSDSLDFSCTRSGVAMKIEE